MVRSVVPRVSGFPRLPAHLDLPRIKRYAAEHGVTEEAARRALRRQEEEADD